MCATELAGLAHLDPCGLQREGSSTEGDLICVLPDAVEELRPLFVRGHQRTELVHERCKYKTDRTLDEVTAGECSNLHLRPGYARHFGGAKQTIRTESVLVHQMRT